MPKKTKMRKQPNTRVKRPRVSKAWYNKKYSTMELASKAWSTAKYLATLVNVETKMVDINPTTVPNTDFTSTGIVHYLSGTAQGTDYNNRVGNSIKSQFMNLVLQVSCSTACRARVILFRDRECRQATPAITDVLEYSDPYSQYNHNNLDRFTILKDVMHSIDPYHPVRLLEWSKADKTHIRYDGTSANVSAADENSIFLLFLSDQSVSADAPSAIYGFRLGFVDN